MLGNVVTYYSTSGPENPTKIICSGLLWLYVCEYVGNGADSAAIQNDDNIEMGSRFLPNISHGIM